MIFHMITLGYFITVRSQVIVRVSMESHIYLHLQLLSNLQKGTAS